MSTLDYLEQFKQIDNTLKNREEPITIFTIERDFEEFTIDKARELLSAYVSQDCVLNSLDILFTAEIIEFNRIKTLFIESKNQEMLEKVLTMGDDLIDFNVFAVCKKGSLDQMECDDNNKNEKDYWKFSYKNKVVKNIEVTTLSKDNFVGSVDNSKLKNGINSNNNNSAISKTAKNNSNFSKQNVDTKNSKYVNTNLSNDLNSNLSINGKKNATKPNPNPKTISNTNTNTKDKVKSETLSNSNTSNNNTPNVTPNITPDIKIESNSNLTPGEDGEFHYDGGVSINTVAAGKRKRDNDEDCYTGDKKNKNTPAISVGKSSANSKNSDIKMESDSEISNISSNESKTVPKKVRKTRRIKKTNTYLDDKGYMRTIDEWEDEEYWTDEKPKLIMPVRNVESKKPSKKVSANQSTLSSFFKR